MNNNESIEEIKKKLRQDETARELTKKCLKLAIEEGQKEFVYFFLSLLEKDLPEDALCCAIGTCCDIKIVEMLLEAGADVHACVDRALRDAAENGHIEVVKMLLEVGADVHAWYDEALRKAAKKGHKEVVKILLEAGADVHAEDEDALRGAAKNGHKEVVEMLLEAGADVHACSEQALRGAVEKAIKK